MRSSIVRLLVSSVIVLALATSAVAEELEKALAALRSGDWKEAAAIAEQVKPDAPDYLRAQYVCGEAYLVLGDVTSAELTFRQVLEKRPDALPVMIGHGRALARLGKLEESERILVKAVAADSKDALALFALGSTHLLMRKTKEAKGELGKAYALDPSNPLVARGWCEWLFADNDDQKALKVAQDLSKALPKHPMGPFLEGLALEREGKDKKALAAYEEALKRDDKFLDAHKNLAILCHTRNPTYQDLERTDKAIEHYARYFELGGKDKELEQVYLQFKGFYDEYIKPLKR